MNIWLARDGALRLVARLREGDVETEVSGWNPAASAEHLLAALEAAEVDGYGECFWPEPTGQYWWLLRREERRLEVVVLWSNSPAAGWQHVFRAADEITYFRDRVRNELAQCGLPK